MYEIQVDANWHENQHKGRCRYPGCAPCAVCGRMVDTNKSHWSVHLHHGGFVAVTEAEAEALNETDERSADMGCFPVGPECAKAHPGLRPYLYRHPGVV